MTIDVPENEWTFVPFADSRCMDDSATGIAVNFTSKSEDLVIFLEGGNACFNNLSCLSTANPNGYSKATFESDGLDALEQGVGEYPAGFGHGHLLVDLSLPDVAHLAFGVADVVDRELHDDRKLHRPRTIHAGVTQRLPGIRQRAQSWKLPGVHHAR